MAPTPPPRVQVFAEAVVEEGRLGDLPVLVLVQDDLGSLEQEEQEEQEEQDIGSSAGAPG